jgi:hypothetical protein
MTHTNSTRLPQGCRCKDIQSGFVLITAMFLMIVFMAFLLVYNEVTRTDIVTTTSSKDSANGFFAAEAGLNVRAEQIRKEFVGYGNAPKGEGPVIGDDEAPCTGSNMGDAVDGENDLGCEVMSIGNRQVTTFLTRDPGNSYNIEIPVGEKYQGLNAIEDRFTASSTARNRDSGIESILELTFRNRSIPLFQFGVFFDADLELYPGSPMTMNGPIHSNGDIYLSSSSNLTMQGQITSAEDIILNRKQGSGSCGNGAVFAWDQSGTPREMTRCSGALSDAALEQFNGTVQSHVTKVDVPPPGILDPSAGNQYWDLADIRLVVRLNNTTGQPDVTNSVTSVEVRNVDNSVNTTLTNALHDGTKCPGNIRSMFLTGRDSDNSLDDDLSNAVVDVSNKVVGVTNLFYDRRELIGFSPIQTDDTPETLLEIDMTNLLNCIARQSDTSGDGLPDSGGTHLLGQNSGGVIRGLNDDSDGGLVLFATVDGPRSDNQQSFYGVRVRNGKVLQATGVPGAPRVKGLTVVTNQPFYVMGDYNYPDPESDRIPAAFLSDTFNILSNSWCPAIHEQDMTAWDNSSPPLCDIKSLENNRTRRMVTTQASVNAAVLSGSDVTDDTRGSGGVHNYPRLHETWGSVVLRYRGSLVSLSKPRHADGAYECCSTSTAYNPPIRDWGFEENFKNFTLLPPATPTIGYLKQQLFERTFDR